MDLISREDAIDALLKLGDSYLGEDEVKRGIAQSQRIIYELPSAEHKPTQAELEDIFRPE